MQADLIFYARTPLGDTALVTRRSELGYAATTLLTLVNGRNTHEYLVDVTERLGAPANSVDMLINDGYIRRLNIPAPIIEPDPLLSVESAAAPTEAERLALLYLHMIGAARQHLGLKGVLFHLKIEKAATLEDYRGLLEPLAIAITKDKGVATADTFLKAAKLLAGG
jgi:hypothetical protein